MTPDKCAVEITVVDCPSTTHALLDFHFNVTVFSAHSHELGFDNHLHLLNGPAGQQAHRLLNACHILAHQTLKIQARDPSL